MAFVPGFEHDVFISYAHGDDPDWISRFHERLKSTLGRLLPGAGIWIDKYDLRKSRDFEKDIPASLESSAVLISLVSPTYITRPYCVHQECRRFVELAAARKQPGQRFAGPEFAADLFGFRCPILPIADKAYWSGLIPGATDISFCKDDDIEPFPVGSPAFEEQFRDLLARQLKPLLWKMRNHSTPVLLYPRNASSELKEAHSALSRELNARSYRVLPEHEFDPAPDVRRCDLVVLLLGAGYDENAERLIDAATELRKRFLVWPSPALERRGELAQVGFLEAIRKSESAGKILLSPEITPEKLKQEVFAVLDPRATISPAPDGKPRVYLIYDSRQPGEKNHAAEIAYAYRNEFHFDGSENPRQHTVSLTHSDGVLLVWGKADENWFAWEFDQMFRLSQRPKARGLCLFDPQESKIALAEKIRSADSAIHVAEAFGRLDPSRLEPFFEPIRRGAA